VASLIWVQSYEEVKRVLKKVLWGCVAAELVIGQFMCTGPKKMHARLHHSLNKIKKPYAQWQFLHLVGGVLNVEWGSSSVDLDIWIQSGSHFFGPFALLMFTKYT
jgi:hypothetical protein